MDSSREFRAKDIDNGRWVYGYYVKREEITLAALWSTQAEHDEAAEKNTKHFIFNDGFSDWNMKRPWLKTDIDPVTLGQCTGFRDQDKKLIYEGDIIEYFFNGATQLGSVAFKRGSYVINHHFTRKDSTGAEEMYSVEGFHLGYAIDGEMSGGSKKSTKVKILGNIFDNLELL